MTTTAPQLKLTATEIVAVPCPECGVDAGVPCAGLSSPWSHQERLWKAGRRTCGKTVYTSRKFAGQVARKQSRQTQTLIKAYRCRLCHGWHTGHPGRPSAPRAKH